jgi:hypothetical protein
MITNEKRSKEASPVNSVKTEGSKTATAGVCSICGKAAAQLVDGEPSCADHLEQVYEHQVEDYTRAHLTDNEWRKV